jgi:hypothetical protein
VVWLSAARGIIPVYPCSDGWNGFLIPERRGFGFALLLLTLGTCQKDVPTRGSDDSGSSNSEQLQWLAQTVAVGCRDYSSNPIILYFFVSMPNAKVGAFERLNTATNLLSSYWHVFYLSSGLIFMRGITFLQAGAGELCTIGI